MAFNQSNFDDALPNLDCLQLRHQQLELALQQSQQILDLQVKLLNAQNISTDNQIAVKQVQNLLQDQAAVRSHFTENLLKNQVQVEREQEMKQIIQNYQKRIYDLRAILIYKEAEIHYLGEEAARGPFKKNDIKNVSSQTTEQIALLKAIRQRKKLTVQVQALQHTLKSIIPSSLSVSSMPKGTIKQQNIGSNVYYGKENSIQRDGLTQRAIRAMVSQIQKQNQLHEEQIRLRNQLIGLETNHQKLKQTYIKLVQTRKNQLQTVNLKDAATAKSNGILDTIDQASQSKVSHQAENPKLLVSIELNQPLILSPTVKAKRKVTTLKERNIKKHKEN